MGGAVRAPGRERAASGSALPLVFFGWWLYMTELRQFHGFQGFSFDFPQCYNATPSHEHHEL